MNDTIKLIQTHTSKRKFTEQKPTRDEVGVVFRKHGLLKKQRKTSECRDADGGF